MGTFGKTFTREIGKNTGKWVSNKVFGSGHSTPHRVIHEREKENRRIERDNARNFREQQKEYEKQRREREKRIVQLEKQMAEREKQQMISSNISEVAEHENYINVIQSVHKDYSVEMNWSRILNIKEPDYIKKSIELEDVITRSTNNFIDEQIRIAKENSKLSFASLLIGNLYEEKYAWLFKVASNKAFYTFINVICIIGVMSSIQIESFIKYPILIISLISLAVLYLIKQGAKDFNSGVELENTIENLENSRKEKIKENLDKQDEKHKLYLEEKEDFDKITNIAKGVLNKDSQSYTYALNLFDPFEDLNDYGSDISFNVSPDIIYVDYYVHSEDVVPKNIKKILRKGAEIKEEPMPISRFNEIYQDYVCSCILRIAKEIFQLLPVVENVQINAKGSIINKATGNYEEKTIVTVKIDRKKLTELNFQLLDPSDSMSNFEHRMDFKKTEGFNPVEDL